MKITIEIDENVLDDEAFDAFRTAIRYLSDDQCRKAMRQLILGQPAEDAEMAMLARIAEYLAFGAKYSGLSREDALAAFKEALTEDALRAAWEACDF